MRTARPRTVTRMQASPDPAHVPGRVRVLLPHPSSDLYGSDRQMLETVTAFVERGWHVVVAMPPGGPLEPLVVERGAEVVAIDVPVLSKRLLSPRRALAFAWASLVGLVTLPRAVRQARADVVWVNTLTIPAWLVAGRLARVPTVCHVHEAEDDAPALVRWVLTAPLVLAGRVVTNSHAAHESLRRSSARSARRVTVVHNGVPGPDDEPAPPRTRTPDDPLRLALVGRLSPRKGTDVALEAVAIARGRDVDASLTVVGTQFPGYEWFVDELESRSRDADLAGHVAFLGYVHPTWPVLADADAVLVPSRVEPFGNTAVEGMLAQRPVVASRTQGLAEVVSDGVTGVSVPPGDAEALADAICHLAADPAEARQLAAAGRAEALNRFSVDAYAEAVGHVLADAAASRRGRARGRGRQAR